MKKSIKIGEKAKIRVDWHVKPLDYSREKEANIAAKFAKKYGLKKEDIQVSPKYIVSGSDGKDVPMTNDVIMNIQDPKFQQRLFVAYAEDNKIEGFDLDAIKEIDAQINSLIDYDIYDKYKRYEVKWIKWSNFLSYGPDNFMDFTKLHGLIHLKGEPANQSGKTTFAYDLLHFLLFGKPSNEKADVLAGVFNNHLPEATEVSVEGCLCIEGQDYIIKRVLTRPALARRTEKSKVTQKISYYKIVNGEQQELNDIDNMEGASGTETNKIIKEAIGNEKDFDLVISANADNLKSLISLKDTDRGRLFSRWIGLLPLEEKDKLAREKWNREVQPRLLTNKYNRQDLLNDIDTLNETIKSNEEINEKVSAELETIKKNIEALTAAKESLIASKQPIDAELLKVDVVTVENKINNIVEQGKLKRAEVKAKKAELDSIGEVTFSEEDYKKLVAEDKADEAKLAEYRTEVRSLRTLNDNLTKSEVCPTCGRKFDDIDNSAKIEANNNEISRITELGKALSETQKERQKKISGMEEARNAFNRKNMLEVEISALNLTITNLLHEHKEQTELKEKFNNNRDAIAKNNETDLAIQRTTVNIETEDNRRIGSIREIDERNRANEDYKKQITEKQGIISQIEAEEKKVRDWKIYLQLVGKDGIGKMVLRQALPIINSELARLLDGLVDFKVEVVIDNNNDVAFNLIASDGVVSKLNSGSGLEKTAASIALRAVLGKISTMPKPSFIVLDEVLGGVAGENYDYIKELYDRILPDYSHIFHITHLPLEDWASQTILVRKENHISKIVEGC